MNSRTLKEPMTAFTIREFRGVLPHVYINSDKLEMKISRGIIPCREDVILLD